MNALERKSAIVEVCEVVKQLSEKDVEIATVAATCLQAGYQICAATNKAAS